MQEETQRLNISIQKKFFSKYTSVQFASSQKPVLLHSINIYIYVGVLFTIVMSAVCLRFGGYEQALTIVSVFLSNSFHRISSIPNLLFIAWYLNEETHSSAYKTVQFFFIYVQLLYWVIPISLFVMLEVTYEITSSLYCLE